LRKKKYLLIDCIKKEVDWEIMSFLASGKHRKVILKLLKETKTPTQIKNETNLHFNIASRTILKLTEKGLVECLNPNQKMAWFYRITKKGWGFLNWIENYQNNYKHKKNNINMENEEKNQGNEVIEKTTEVPSRGGPSTGETTSKIKEERDEEIDMASATEIARDFVKENVGNLNLHQFRMEEIKKNGDKTKYIVICSVVEDLGEEREYYLMKVDVLNGKLVPPAGRGKKVDNELKLSEITIDPKWVE